MLSYETCLDTKPVFYPLSKLQNWICLKMGQHKTCIVSNTKFEASIRATQPKPSQSHITSQRIKIFIQNKKAGFVSAQIGLGAAGLA